MGGNLDWMLLGQFQVESFSLDLGKKFVPIAWFFLL